jgi:hypothetical protein
MPYESYIYCFIRKDLPVVHQLIQLGHACHCAGRNREIGVIPNLVLFEVKDENALHRITFDLDEHRIDHSLFREPDMNYELTAICTEIIDSEEKRDFFRGFNLYRD